MAGSDPISMAWLRRSFPSPRASSWPPGARSPKSRPSGTMPPAGLPSMAAAAATLECTRARPPRLATTTAAISFATTGPVTCGGAAGATCTGKLASPCRPATRITCAPSGRRSSTNWPP